MIAGLAAAMAVVAAATALRRRRPERLRVRNAARGHEQLDDACVSVMEVLSRELRAGRTLVAAVRTALGAHPRCLPALRTDLDRDAPLAASAEAVDPSGPSERVVLQTVRACARTGGALADTVDRALVVLRERGAFARDREVHSAQARSSALVMTLVPLAFAAFTVATSERIREVYATTPAAVVLAACGLVLNAGGWMWMRRVIRGRPR